MLAQAMLTYVGVPLSFTFNCIEELQQRLFRRISSSERIDEHGEDASGAISARDVVHRQQRAKQQTRANEQQHGSGHFTDDEQGAHRAPAGSRRPRLGRHRLRLTSQLRVRATPAQDRTTTRARAPPTAQNTPTRMSNVGASRRRATIPLESTDGVTLRMAAPTATPSAPPSAASTRLSVSS